MQIPIYPHSPSSYTPAYGSRFNIRLERSLKSSPSFSTPTSSSRKRLRLPAWIFRSRVSPTWTAAAAGTTRKRRCVPSAWWSSRSKTRLTGWRGAGTCFTWNAWRNGWRRADSPALCAGRFCCRILLLHAKPGLIRSLCVSHCSHVHKLRAILAFCSFVCPWVSVRESWIHK